MVNEGCEGVKKEAWRVELTLAGCFGVPHASAAVSLPDPDRQSACVGVSKPHRGD